MAQWSEIELAHGTIWLETKIAEFEIWLEWNDRVMAYRFGIVKNGEPSKSSLGFADSLDDAKLLCLSNVPT